MGSGQSIPAKNPPCMMCLLESVQGLSSSRQGGRLAGSWIGGTVCPWVKTTVGELGPPVLRARPEQMIGSKSRMQKRTFIVSGKRSLGARSCPNTARLKT